MNDIVLNNRLLCKNPLKFDKYFRQIHASLSDLSQEYSNFDYWYFHKVLSGISKGERSVLVKEHKNQLVAVAILKKTMDETKICTFRVMENFQRFGFGQEMILGSFDLLEVNQPLITVSSNRLKEFSKLLAKNNFILFQEYSDYYYSGISEFAFNGPIEKVLVGKTPKMMPFRLISSEDKSISHFSI